MCPFVYINTNTSTHILVRVVGNGGLQAPPLFPFAFFKQKGQTARVKGGRSTSIVDPR